MNHVSTPTAPGIEHRLDEVTEHPRDHPRLFSLAVLAIYVSLGVVAYWPVLSGGLRAIYTSSNPDPIWFVWNFAWTAHALVSGHNPFFTGAINVPLGANLAANTSQPLLGTVMAPLTLIAGPAASATVCTVAAMPLSSASAYWVLRRCSVWAPAAAVGGLVYGFSPYMIDQGASHLNLVFVPLPPLIVAAVVKITTRPRYPARWGAVLGGLVVAQYLISSEILAMTALAVVVAVVLVALNRERHDPGSLKSFAIPAARGLVVTVTIAAALLAYPIWAQFRGPGHFSGPPVPIDNPYYAHVLHFVAPTQQQVVRPLLGGIGAGLAAPSGAEAGAYIGLGLLALLVVLVWRFRRSERVRLAAVLAGIFAVLSLGRFMVIDNRQSPVPLPFDGLAHLPVLNGILPIRFSFVTDACIAAILALALDEMRRREPRSARQQTLVRRLPQRARSGWAVAVVAVVVVVMWLPQWPYASQKAPTLPSAVVQAIPAGDPVVLAYPYPVSSDDRAMLWQADTGFRFKLLGGYMRRPDSHGRATLFPPLLDPPALQEYLVLEGHPDVGLYPSPPAREQVVVQARTFIERQHVSAVIVDFASTGGQSVAHMFSEALGRPQVSSGTFLMWTEGVPKHGQGQPLLTVNSKRWG